MNSSYNLPLIGLVQLATHAFSGADLTPIAEQLVARLQQHHQQDASALMDLATIHYLWHQPEAALEFQQAAMQQQRRYQLSTSATEPSLKLLALVGTGDLMSNLPVEFLLGGSQTIRMDLHYICVGDALPDDLEDYDLMIIAVGESDRNKPLLQQLSQQLQTPPIPLINHPNYVMQTTREGAADAFQHCEGVIMPMSVRVTRENLQALSEGSIELAELLNDTRFPIIIRPVESHAGHGLERLDNAKDITTYLTEQSDETLFYISPFIDYASEDGQFRKYRVVLIKGKPFLAHLAISSHWIVHYLNADMVGDELKCREEAECMANFDKGFGRTYQAAFAAMYEALPLEYLIIDCAETDDGQLLIFEVDTSAIVHAMDPVEFFPYKRPQMHKIFQAFQQQLAAIKTS